MVRGDETWRWAVLAFDLDAGSKGDLDMVKLADAVVVARKPGTCSVCFGEIAPGTLTRRETAKFEGKVATCRYCQDCCDAMALWPEDDAIDDRYEIGRKRSEATR